MATLPSPPVFACISGLADRAAMEGAYHVCLSLTPRIERHENALVLDMHGSERLLLAGASEDTPDTGNGAGWSILAEALYQRVRAVVSLPALRIGIAASRTVAWLAAHRSVSQAVSHPGIAVPPGEIAAFLAPLPLSLLADVPDVARLPAAVSALDVLAQSGIRTLGQLQRITPHALQRRFGTCGLALATVAAGHDRTPLRVERPDTWIGIRLQFKSPLTVEYLALALEPLAEHVALTLVERQEVAGIVALVLYPEIGEPLRTYRELRHPVAAASALLQHARHLVTALISPSTASSQQATGETAYSAVRLRVGRLFPASLEQRALWTQDARSHTALRRERLRVVLHAIERMGDDVALLHAILRQPEAIFPEERYRLDPLHQESPGVAACRDATRRQSPSPCKESG